MKRALRVVAGLLIALPACTAESPTNQRGVGEVVEPLPPRQLPPSEQLYDADGVPLQSDERLAGLVLPVGLDLERSQGRRHYYVSEIPTGRLLRYFGPRLMTLNVERAGERVTYHEAVPRGVRGGIVKLDVTIRPSRAYRARVDVYERPPDSTVQETVSADQIRRHLDGLNQQRE